MFGNLAEILIGIGGNWTPPAGSKQFSKSKHSVGQRRKADPRRKKLRKISDDARRRNRVKR